MATAHFFGLYPPTRELSLFNPYTKNIELKSSFHPRSRNNTGKSKTLISFRGPETIRRKPSKTLTSFWGPEAIRAKHHSEVPKQYGQNNYFEVPKQYGQNVKTLISFEVPKRVSKASTLFLFSLSGFFIGLTRSGK